MWRIKTVGREIAKGIKGIGVKKEYHHLPMKVEGLDCYPRPLLVRDSFLSLNGMWSIKPEGDAETDIRVPYAPETRCSGFSGKLSDKYIYRKTFTIPEDFNTGRVILHFMAVDQVCEVLLNGIKLGRNAGGYLPFKFDVTDALQTENELVVKVIDSFNRKYPYGKQSEKPGGMWYTKTSGIWGTVWMEAVPEKHIDEVVCTFREPELVVTIKGTTDRYVMKLSENGREFELKNGENRINIDSMMDAYEYWSPENPKLYDFTLSTEDETIGSYFALRTLSIEEVDGRRRMCLNHRPYFFHGVLDQGYYSEGGLTAPSDECFENDIRAMKDLGFNTLRMHIKIEHPEFYHQCDRLGMIVFQDMVENGEYNYLTETIFPTFMGKFKKDRKDKLTETQKIFKKQAVETVRYLKGFPSICLYTVFNEGWGQFNSLELTGLLKKEDDTRFYDSASGWFKQGGEEILSDHVYFHPVEKVKTDKPRIISECGGFVRQITDHMYVTGSAYGYGDCADEKALTNRICALYTDEVIPLIREGVNGCIYTQLSDVEEEINGLLTFDRAVCKVDAAKMRELAAKLKITG